MYLWDSHWCSVCEPAKIFLTSTISYLLFCNPAHETEKRTANRWELLVANHLEQSKTGSRSQIIFITLFSSRWTALLRCVPASASKRYLPASTNWAYIQEKNHFPEPHRHMLTFLPPILVCSVTYWAPVGMLLGPNSLGSFAYKTHCKFYHKNPIKDRWGGPIARETKREGQKTHSPQENRKERERASPYRGKKLSHPRPL